VRVHGFGKLFLLIATALCCASPGLAQLVRPMVGESSLYLTKEGEDLLSIAEAHSLAIEHLAFANGYPVTSINVLPGTLLTIPGQRVLPADPPRDGLVLNVPERGLYLFSKGKFADFVPVSVGHPPKNMTPLGNFHIIEKVMNPTWYPTKSANQTKPIPPGPDNPLGDRWIGLSAARVGIHSTNNPLDVGGTVTLGCIRCYPNEIRKLYPKVYVGMPIRIEYETAKLGKDDSGELQIVTFPDIYQKSESYPRSVALLAKVGKSGMLDDKKFVGKLRLNLGVPLNLGKPKSKQVG
jgi:L,D-transpeptidase ErfK/SrfK